MNKYSVGANIDAWCTKCKLILAHTIEAIDSETIKRVQCNTCKGKHMFRAGEPKSKSASAAGTKSKSRELKGKASDYKRILQNKDVKKAQSYNFRTQFKKGQLINHVKFGVGVVVEERDAQKIEVLFESGSKILVHARP